MAGLVPAVHAVMARNAPLKGDRRFIQVWIAEAMS
jgi:hypothetical protein